jgi:hypothetical protein
VNSSNYTACEEADPGLASDDPVVWTYSGPAKSTSVYLKVGSSCTLNVGNGGGGGP